MQTLKEYSSKEIFEIVLFVAINLVFGLNVLFCAGFLLFWFIPSDDANFWFATFTFFFGYYHLFYKTTLLSFIHRYGKDVLPFIWQILDKILNNSKFCYLTLLIAIGIDCSICLALFTILGAFSLIFLFLGITFLYLSFIIISKVIKFLSDKVAQVKRKFTKKQVAILSLLLHLVLIPVIALGFCFLPLILLIPLILKISI